MLAVTGVFLLALCACFFAWSALVFHRADPPAWTRADGPGAWVTLGIMLLAVLGIGALIKFGIEFRTQPFDTAHMVAIAAIVGLAALLIANRRRLVGRPRPAAGATVGAALAGRPANDRVPPASRSKKAA